MSAIRRSKDQQPAKRAQSRLRRFVFTLNNYTEEEYLDVTTRLTEYCKWMIVAKETGEQGTPHLQGACILEKQTAFSTIKTLPGLRRARLAEMRGKPEDSVRYCSKQDLQPFEFGSLPSPGKRNDIHNAAERILEGQNLRDLAKDTEGAVAVVKFHKGLTVLRSLTRPDRSQPPKVFWIYGQTGTCKTRCAFESARELVGNNDDDIWISSGGLRWFDGYDGQSVAIFDDFRAKHVLNFAFFLRLLDRYPMSVEFKGGFVKWLPRFIFITCPYEPDVCFSKRKEHVPEDIAQLHRRLTKVYHFANKLKKGARTRFIESVRSFVPRDDGPDNVRDGMGTTVPGADLEEPASLTSTTTTTTTTTTVINLEEDTNDSDSCPPTQVILRDGIAVASLPEAQVFDNVSDGYNSDLEALGSAESDEDVEGYWMDGNLEK